MRRRIDLAVRDTLPAYRTRYVDVEQTLALHFSDYEPVLRLPTPGDWLPHACRLQLERNTE